MHCQLSLSSSQSIRMAPLCLHYVEVRSSSVAYRSLRPLPLSGCVEALGKLTLYDSASDASRKRGHSFSEVCTPQKVASGDAIWQTVVVWCGSMPFESPYPDRVSLCCTGKGSAGAGEAAGKHGKAATRHRSHRERQLAAAVTPLGPWKYTQGVLQPAATSWKILLICIPLSKGHHI